MDFTLFYYSSSWDKFRQALFPFDLYYGCTIWLSTELFDNAEELESRLAKTDHPRLIKTWALIQNRRVASSMLKRIKLYYSQEEEAHFISFQHDIQIIANIL